jgi:hypothetical protein
MMFGTNSQPVTHIIISIICIDKDFTGTFCYKPLNTNFTMMMGQCGVFMNTVQGVLSRFITPATVSDAWRDLSSNMGTYAENLDLNNL